MSLKICIRCGEAKERDQFRKASYGSINNTCIQCFADKSRATRQANHPTGAVYNPADDEEPSGAVYNPDHDEEPRICIVCTELKPYTAFRLQRGHNNRSATCQECISKRHIATKRRRPYDPPEPQEIRDGR